MPLSDWSVRDSARVGILLARTVPSGDGNELEICYLKDPVDLFFSQIQGSVRVRLEDGSMLRLNYDAHNGHPYTPVGRVLIERKIYTRDQMSMDRIREWMTGNPEVTCTVPTSRS